MADPFYANGERVADSALASRRKLAEALMRNGSDYSPVQHWAQGLARLSQALIGGYEAGQLDRAEQAGIAEQNQRDGRMMAAVGGGGAAPAAAGGAPADTSAAPAAASAAPPSSMLPTFARAENQYALPSNYLPQVAKIESSFNPNAKNPASSAKGLFQFTNGTARDYGLVNPFDPVASTDAAARLAADNRSFLRSAIGRDPTPGELYLAHQQGAGGAAKLLSNPDARAVDIVGRKAVINNGGNENMRAGDFARLWTRKVADNAADLPAPNAAVAESNTGAPGFFIPPGNANDDMPAVDAMGNATGVAPSMPQAPMVQPPAQPLAEQASVGPSQAVAPATAPDAVQPLSPTFTAEGLSQPWMGTALDPPAVGKLAVANALAQTMPPSRPADLAMPQADLPAPGAIQAMGQAVPNQAAMASYPPINPNSDDAGALSGLVASEEARKGLPSGAGITNPITGLAQALMGATPPANPFTKLAQALAGGQQEKASAGAPVSPALPAGTPAAYAGGSASPAGQQSAAAPAPARSPQVANPALADAYATIRSPYATQAQKQIAQTIISQAVKGSDYENVTRPDGSVWRVPKTGSGAPSQIFGAQSKPEERTGNAKEYDIYVAQEKAAGRTPDTFTTWERANKAAGSTNISIDTKGAQAFAARASELQAKRYGDMVDGGDAARSMQGDLDMLEGMMKGLQTGRGAEMRLSMAQFAKSFGFDDIASGLTGGKLGEMEAFSSMIDKLTPTMRQGMPGAASDRDVAMFRNALPNLLKTPEGNQILMHTLRSMNDYRMRAGDLAGQAMRGEVSQGDADRRLRELESPFVQFRKYRDEAAKAGGQGGASIQPSPSQPSGVTGQTKSGLKWSVQ